MNNEADARDSMKRQDPRGTRGPESGETSFVAGASQPQSGLPFAKLPVEFGRYRVEKLLGAGAMGAVYLATDSKLDRPVAIKVPKLSKSGSPALLARMEREAKALAQLDHPNLCKIYDFNVIDGVRFIALEYVQGETLKSLLQRLGRKRKVSDAVAMTVQLARALGAAHEKGVVHRDLKPENIMRRPEGRLVIMDFGLNNRQSQFGEDAAHRTQQGTILGTPAYMSPEQAAGRLEEVDQRSDIYALGVMLYEMLTGELPFSGTAMEIMGRKTILPAPSPLSVNEKLPPELAGICERMLAQKPENRTATCAEIAKALKACDLTPRSKGGSETDDEAQTVTVSGGPPNLFREQDDGAPAPHGGRNLLSLLRSLFGPAAAWWFDQPRSFQIALAGAVAVVAILLGIILGRTDPGLRLAAENVPSLAKPVAIAPLSSTETPATQAPSESPPVTPRSTAGPPIHLEGAWQVEGDELIQPSPEGAPIVFFGDPQWTNYTFRYEVQKTEGPFGAGALFRARDTRNYMLTNLSAWRNSRFSAERILNGTQEFLHFVSQRSMQPGRWYRVEIRVSDLQQTITVDGVREFFYSDAALTRGAVGFATWGAAARFRKIEVVDEQGQVLWKGPPTIAPSSTAKQAGG